MYGHRPGDVIEPRNDGDRQRVGQLLVIDRTSDNNRLVAVRLSVPNDEPAGYVAEWMKPVIKIEERIAYFQNHLDGIVARMKDSQQAMTGLGIGDPVAGPNLETAMQRMGEHVRALELLSATHVEFEGLES
jgi:hypothetical protein